MKELVLRYSAASLLWFLLMVIIDGATIPLELKNGNGRKSTTIISEVEGSLKVPLVVSVPSKVFRANKVNSNDVFERPIELVILPEDRNPRLMTSVRDLDFALPPFVTTTTGKTTTTEMASSTTENEVQTTTSLPKLTTSTTKMTTTTTTTTEPVPASTKTSSSTAAEVVKETSTEVDTTTVITTMSNVGDNLTLTLALSSTPSTSGDEVIERDYGQSLGGINGNVEEPVSENEDEQSKEPKMKKEDNAELTDSEIHFADDRMDGDFEVDPMEADGGQASELDYVVLNPAEFTLRNSHDMSSLTNDRSSGIGLNDRSENSTEVGKSMSYSVAVLHPLGEFQDDRSTIAVKPIKNGHLKKFKSQPAVKNDKQESLVVLTSSSNGDRNGNGNVKSGDLETAESQQTLLYHRLEADAEPEVGFEEPEVAGDTSQQRSLYLLEPEFERRVEDVEASSSMQENADEILDDQPPEVDAAGSPDENEYEYIYEYIDLNSTDLPSDLPDGAVIVSDEIIPSNLPNLTTGVSDQVNGSSGMNSIDINNNVTVLSPMFQPGLIQPITSEVPIQRGSSEGVDSTFVPGMPESPVYFVGIRSEKVKSQVGANDVNDQKPTGDRLDQAQLLSLYALSKALPFDGNPMVKTMDGNGSDSASVPANLPDPFSEEFLRGDDDLAKSNESLTTESTTTEAASTTTTTIPTTTVTAKITESTSTTAGRGNGNRPRGSRRTTTTTTVATPTSSSGSEIALTGRGKTSRSGGRRRSSTAAPVDNSEDVEGSSEASVTTTTTEKPKFGGRGRSRFTGPNRGNKPTSAEPDVDGGDANKINGERPSSGRRATSSTTIKPNTGNSTKKEDKKPGARKNTRPGASSSRNRRPTATSGDSQAVDKTTASTINDEGATEVTPSRKNQLFRPRNRGRFATSKSKSTGSEVDAQEDEIKEEGSLASETVEKSSSTSSTKEKEVSPVTTESYSSSSVPEPEPASVDEVNVDDEQTEDSDVGPPRKFPPRFKPGSRATIPHRTTESSA